METVSKGHGLGFHDGYDEPEATSNMNRIIFDYLDALFPAVRGSVIGEAGGNGQNGFVNGAQGGMGECCQHMSSLTVVGR